MFCSFKGEGTGAVRHLFSHHILKPERQPLEANVWGTPQSSGAFSTLFETRLLRLLDYRSRPFEVEVVQVGQHAHSGKRSGCNPTILNNLYYAQTIQDIRTHALYLACGDSAKTDLPDQSVDLIATDPPFFDNVHYSELADFFYAWQLPLLGVINGQNTTRHPGEVQDQNASAFASKLTDVFAECHRVLKDGGLLTFTYHHSRAEGWSAVARAIISAGFSLVAAQPVKAEMSVAAPKQQAKEPIDLDIIMVCRKSMEDQRSYKDVAESLAIALRCAANQVMTFQQQKRRLSRNDLQIILHAQMLVTLFAGRTTHDLITDFEALIPAIEAEIEMLYHTNPQLEVHHALGIRS